MIAEVVRTHYPSLLKTALRLVRDVDRAKDLVQEVLLAFLKSGGRYPPPYLYTLLRCRLVSSVRKEKRRREVSIDDVGEPPAPEGGSGFETRDEVRAAVSQLSEKEVDLLTRRYLLDQSIAAIAEELGITRNAARARLHRALTRVREIWPKLP